MLHSSMNRREAVATMGLTAAVAATSLGVDKNADKSPGWIDAHSHIWPPDTDRYPLAAGQTKKDLDPPSFTDDELMAIAGPEGVERVVLIQHSVFHLFDNSYLIDAVKRHPQRFRIVGMVDDTKPEPGAAMKKLLDKRVTGFRITPLIRKENPETWLTTPGMNEMWKTAVTTRQAMCCLINPADIPSVSKMCARHPETPVVIDHFGRVGIDGEIHEADLKALCDLARHKHVKVKISAFYALGKKRPPHTELVPMIKRLFETFGPQRLMWASDSPYQLQGENNYAASITLVRDHLDFLTPEDRLLLLRTTAEKTFFYV